MAYNPEKYQGEISEFDRLRSNMYPPLREQLDMLYHDIKSGNLENGNWIAAIEEVKNTITKR